MYLTEKQIALTVQTSLNAVATALYTASTITTQVVFYVTANTQEYDELRTGEYAVGTDIPYTPILLSRITSSVQDDAVSGVYKETYLCEIYAHEQDKDSIETIFTKYAYDETYEDSKVIGSWTVLKSRTSKLNFLNIVRTGSGKNVKRLIYSFDFTWDFVIGGVADEASTFTIDGSAIDVLGVAFASDKISIANVAYGTNVRPLGATGFTLSLTIPANTTSTIAKNIWADIASKSFNKTYTIVWTIASFGTQTYTMTLKRGSFNYVRDQLLSYTATFEEALARTTITVDSVAIPVLSFNFNRRVKPLQNADGTEVKTSPSETSYLMTAHFAYDSTTAKSVSLLTAILDGSYMETTYTVAVAITGGISKSYTCVLVDGTYAFEQTGELSYTCTFAEVHPNGV